MLMGTAPFVDDFDPMQIYQKIVKGSCIAQHSIA